MGGREEGEEGGREGVSEGERERVRERGGEGGRGRASEGDREGVREKRVDGGRMERRGEGGWREGGGEVNVSTSLLSSDRIPVAFQSSLSRN